MRRVLMSVVVVLGFLAANSLVQADLVKVAGTTVFDNSGFENDTVGAVPSVTTGGSWWLSAQTTNYSQVVNDGVPGPKEGTQYLKMHAPQKENKATATFAQATDGQLIHSEWAFLVPDASSADRAKAGQPYGVSLSGDPNKDFYSTSNAAKVNWGVIYPDSGTAAYVDTTGCPSDHLVAFYCAAGGDGYYNLTAGGQNVYLGIGQWHRVKMDYVENAATFSVKIDGVQCDSAASSYGIPGWGYSGTDNLIHWQSTSAGGPNYDAYVDAIGIPEPSATVLLAAELIGLLACAWRKRK